MAHLRSSSSESLSVAVISFPLKSRLEMDLISSSAAWLDTRLLSMTFLFVSKIIFLLIIWVFHTCTYHNSNSFQVHLLPMWLPPPKKYMLKKKPNTNFWCWPCTQCNMVILLNVTESVPTPCSRISYQLCRATCQHLYQNFKSGFVSRVFHFGDGFYRSLQCLSFNYKSGVPDTSVTEASLSQTASSTTDHGFPHDFSWLHRSWISI